MNLTSSPAADSDASLLPLSKPFYTVRETAAFLGCSDQFVRDSFEQGRLFGHQSSGRVRPGQAQRRRVRISRESILLYLAQNATYGPEEVLQRIDAAIAPLPRRFHQRLLERLRAKLAAAEASLPD